MYNLLKFVHVVSIVVWVGGFISMLILNHRIARSGDATLQKAFGQQAAAAGMFLYGPSALVAVITGIGMVQVAGIGFRHTWVLWGILGTVGAVVVGGVLTGGAARKLAQQMAQGTVDRNRIATVQRRIQFFALLNLALLLSTIGAMVFKPA